ncbi:hypothetical protein BDAP_002873 [Binucleata daphniae]
MYEQKQEEMKSHMSAQSFNHQASASKASTQGNSHAYVGKLSASHFSKFGSYKLQDYKSASAQQSSYQSSSQSTYQQAEATKTGNMSYHQSAQSSDSKQKKVRFA